MTKKKKKKTEKKNKIIAVSRDIKTNASTTELDGRLSRDLVR